MVESDEEFRDLVKGSRWGVGDEAFQAMVRDRHTERTLKVRRQEDVSFRRMEAAVPALRVLDAVAEVFEVEPTSLRRRQYNCVARAVAAFMLGRYAGMNQRDIGAFLGMGTGSAVCRQLGRLRERQMEDAALREQMEDIRTALDNAGRQAEP